jgi:hypothetical protein
MANFSCPGCGYVCDTATALGDNKNKSREGNISICLQCAEVSFFNEDGSLRLAGDDLVTLPPETLGEIFRVQAALKDIHLQPKKGGL